MVEFAGFGLNGYRSFAATTPQLIGPLSTVTLLAGQNNAGKSNVLRFAQTILDQVHRQGGMPTIERPSILDAPRLHGETNLEIAIGLDLGASPLDIFDQGKTATLGPPGRQFLEAMLSAKAVRLTGDHVAWIRYAGVPVENAGFQVAQSNERIQFQPSLDQCSDIALEIGGDNISSGVASALTGQASNHLQNIRNLLSAMEPLKYAPRVHTIEAIRRMREPESGEDFSRDFSGVNLIRTLARHQHPGMDRLQDREKFDAINEFLQSVLDDRSAYITIPDLRDTVHFHQAGIQLPLENLGTGLHELIIIAAAASLAEGDLLCIEEPEIHLHPLMQRKLLRYLTETNNKYLIATHSAAMLDAELASIYHVAKGVDGTTTMRRSLTDSERAMICFDLGYRPSDLVQANSVIWVEGPSDRVYLKHWIRELDPKLVEGTHYSIMFYGGRLLKHLTASDPDVEDFISLRRLNRRVAILIDSDKKTRHSSINATKRRILQEFDDAPGFAWLTEGYTIENYIPPELLRKAVEAVHSRMSITWNGDRWSNPLYAAGKTSLDKVAIARHVASEWSSAVNWPSHLVRKVRQTVNFIRDANGQPPLPPPARRSMRSDNR